MIRNGGHQFKSPPFRCLLHAGMIGNVSRIPCRAPFGTKSALSARQAANDPRSNRQSMGRLSDLQRYAVI